MKRSSTLFLKIAVIFIGLPVLALCLFLLPQIASEANEAAARGSRSEERRVGQQGRSRGAADH